MRNLMRCAIAADRFGLLDGGVLVLPERFGRLLLALGREQFPQLRGSRDVGNVGHVRPIR